MNRLEKLMFEIKKQLLPYRHEQDIEKACERWDVSEEDCLTAWIADMLANCRKKNRCSKRELCAYYGYPDIARKNYDVCKEVILLMENGAIGCSFKEKKE